MPSASYSEQAAILYPYLRKHLQSGEMSAIRTDRINLPFSSA